MASRALQLPGPRPVAVSQHHGEEDPLLPATLWGRFAPQSSQNGVLNAGSRHGGHLAVLMDASLHCERYPVTKTLLDEHDEDFLGGKYTIQRAHRTCVSFAAPRPRRLSDEEAMRTLLRMPLDDSR